MIKTKYICDKCGIEKESEKVNMPNDWVSLKYEVKRENNDGYGPKEFISNHFCNNCAKELKLVKDGRTNLNTHNKSIGDRLVEILTEISQGGQQ